MNQNTTNSYISKSLDIAKDIDKKLRAEDFDIINNIGNFISSVEEIISYLFNSILIGEFITDTNFENLNSSEEGLDFSVIKNIDLLSIENILANNKEISDLTRSNIEIFKKRIIQINSIIFDLYIPFVKDVRVILKNQETDIVITSSYKYQITNNDDYVLKIFFLNIYLCLIDILFNETQYCFDKISSIKDEISSIQTNYELRFLKNQVIKIKKKATFLLFKWCKRAKLSGISLYIDKGVESYERELNKYGDDWNSIIKYINNHYYNDKDKNKKYFERELKKSFADIKDKNFEEFSCREIHLYIKYYKDIDKNLEKLDDIILFLEEWKEEEKINNEEKNIRTIIYNYALNNRFSLFTKTCKSKEKLYEEYEKIEEKDNKNYFPQYKLIDKSIELLKAELNEKNNTITIEQIEEIENYLNKIEPAYKTYKTNIEWILEHIYFIYRVSFDECIIDDIFIYSSFLLPLDNRKSKEDYKRINDDFRVLKSQIDPLKRIVQFDEKIEKRDTKTIELMGLFTAIIAFVIGSIPTFQYLKNIFDVGIFFVVFATSLISFLLVLLFITGRIKVNKEQKWWKSPMLYFYPAMIIIASVLSYFNPKDNDRKTTTLKQTEKTVIEEKITSNKAVDTLKQSKITKEHTTSSKDSLK
ncbi:hypothetical protein [Capnocytophaga leadbetteri]